MPHARVKVYQTTKPLYGFYSLTQTGAGNRCVEHHTGVKVHQNTPQPLLDS